jgi:hypothetical protein
MNTKQLTGAGVVGAILTIVGTIGTWATLHAGAASQTIAGTDGGRGKTVIAAAAIGLVLLAIGMRYAKRWVAILATLASLVSFGLVLWTITDLKGSLKGSNPQIPDALWAAIGVDKGWGLWVSTIGSIVLLLACLAVATMKKQAAAVEAPATAPTS